MKNIARGIGLVSILFLSSFFYFTPVSAEVRFPYIIDEKPRVTFSDTIATSTYEGLENYVFEYQGTGYAHISFTYTHRYFSDTNYPPYISVTQTDPRLGGSFPLHRIRQRVYDLGYLDAGDWYKFDLYFDATGYNFRRQRGETNEVLTYRVDIPDMTDTDWIFLANDFPYYHLGDDTAPISDNSMSFTPHVVKNTEIATGTSVMFFPGIMGSRLYDNISGIETEDWASLLDSNQSKLALDSGGKSINNIYTKDDTQNANDEQETGVTDEIYGQNIYNSFINDLRNWKIDGIIKDYAFIPYDWRLSLEDVITNGATTTDGKLFYSNNQDFSQSYILRKLLEIGNKSAHITLVGHSNGGLVIKALMQKLKDTNDPLYYKIDKIIFVAVPQVGTPDAVVNLLHGTSLAGGLLMTNQRSRGLSENMPMAYNLLPTASYFGLVNPGFTIDKVVSFTDYKDAYVNQISKYGFYVSNPTELKDFLLGAEGRVKPTYNDTDKPNIGNPSLYSQAEAVHSLLDNWQPASTTKVIQIAGWGEETTSGVKETTCLDTSVDGYHRCISPVKVVDGDGTVVVPSALWISTSTPNVERWWVNLKNANTIITKKRIHRDILEIQKLQDFIKSEINNSFFNDPTNIVVDDVGTLSSGDSRLHYILHSPLTLGVTDSQGNYTGLDPVTKKIREEISGVTYEIIGDTQYISLPSDLSGQVKLSGYDNGTFSLDIEKQSGNNIVESLSFQSVPVSTTTKVTLDINPLVSSSTISLDKNGDGRVDKIIKSNGQSMVVYDDTPPEISITYSTSTNNLVFDGSDLNPTSITLGPSIVTAIDSQSNKTVLYLSKFKKEPSEVELVLNKIIRGVSTTTLSNIEIKFEVSKNKSGVISEFESKVQIAGKDYLTLKYSAEKKVTVIKEYKNGKYVTVTKPGLVIEKIITSGSGVKFVY